MLHDRNRIIAWLSSVAVLGNTLAAHGGVELGLGSTSYFNANSQSRGEISYPSVTVHGDFVHEGQDWQARLRVGTEQYIDREAPGWIDAPEVSIARRWKVGKQEFRLAAGRELREWSEADGRFALGVWQPLHRADLVRPMQAGLAGIYGDWKSETISVTTFVSPIFIPDRGSPIEVNDGRLESKTPWFVSPPSEVTVLGKDTPMRYRIALPSITKIIFHPSAALRARVGRSRGAWAAAGYGYKPVNRLLMAVDGYFGVGANEVMTTLYPRVLYEHLVSLDAGYQTSRWKTAASLLLDRPVRDRTPTTWTTQEIKASQTLALTGDYALSGDLRSGVALESGILLVNGGDAIDAGPDANGGTRFESRTVFRRAVMAGIRAPLGRFGARARALYDVPREISQVSLDLSFMPAPRWKLHVGADLLGSGETDAETSRYGTWISRYRANDRVHAGVSYVF